MFWRSSRFYIDFLNTYLFRIFLADNILEHHSSAERLVQIINSFTVFFDAPWLGHGLGGVGQYIYDQYSSGREFVFSPSRPFEVDPVLDFDPTNVSVELLASYGIIGTAIYPVDLLSRDRRCINFSSDRSRRPLRTLKLYIL